MIWLSVLIFDNPVTLLAGVGMILVTIGVFIYNKARERETNKPSDQLNTDQDTYSKYSNEPLLNEAMRNPSLPQKLNHMNNSQQL